MSQLPNSFFSKTVSGVRRWFQRQPGKLAAPKQRYRLGNAILGLETLEDRLVLTPATALLDYINKPDNTFAFHQLNVTSLPNVKVYSVAMDSQTWRSPSEVDHTVWHHTLTIYVPNQVTSDTAMLIIEGADGVNTLYAQAAISSHSVVVNLSDVPDDPFTFSDEPGKSRSEDAAIAYTYDKYLDQASTQAEWPLLLPMVKSAVRAMDATQTFVDDVTAGDVEIDHFVVAGASKRGWTTWLTGAVDPRVSGIVPVVFDALNLKLQMENHYASYGFFSQSIKDYDNLNIFGRFDGQQGTDLASIVDPLSYVNNLTMPKYMVNGSGDEFFRSDSSLLYVDQLLGPKWLRYVPNAGHSLNIQENPDALLSIIAFYSIFIVDPDLIPTYSWSMLNDGSIDVTADESPNTVKLWQATNPDANDFRYAGGLGPHWTSTALSSIASNEFVANVQTPSSGATAYFIELTFSVFGQTLTFTSPIRIKTNLPDKTIDFGDAPDSYGTLLASNGARHLVNPGFRLGFRLDAEYNGSPSTGANGDDNSGDGLPAFGYVNDEEGVKFNSILNIGQTSTITVYASRAGKLDAFMDFNGDGDFADPGEKIFNSISLVEGDNILNIQVPDSATPTSRTYARFRLSSAGGLSYDGFAPDGEVEDYAVGLQKTPTVNLVGDAGTAKIFVLEGDSSSRFIAATVALSNVSFLPVSIHYQTVNGTATTGDGDFQSVSGTLNFAPGETTKAVLIRIFGDTKFEGNETFSLQVNNADGGLLGVSDEIIEIGNDEETPAFSVSDVTIQEGNSGKTSMLFIISITGTSQTPIAVHYATQDVTAQAGSDYKAVAGSLVFNPGGPTSQTVAVLENGDKSKEVNEVFYLRLSNATGAVIADSVGRGIIVDDDSKPTPLKIKSVLYNDGRKQSQIETITIQFNQPANIQQLIDNKTIGNFITVTGPNATTLEPGRFRYDEKTYKLVIDLTLDGFGGSRETMLSTGDFRLELWVNGVATMGDPKSRLQDADGYANGAYMFNFKNKR